MSSEPMLAGVRALLECLSDSCIHDGVTDQYIAITRGQRDELVLKPNRCGLIYLAWQLVEIADREPGAHVHLDEASALDACEMPLVIAHRPAPWDD
jgi:hypothetical protein